MAEENGWMSESENLKVNGLDKKRKRNSTNGYLLDGEKSLGIRNQKRRRLSTKNSRKFSKQTVNMPWMKSLSKGVFGDSEIEGRNVFEAMIKPVRVQEFFKNIWEKQPLLVKRRNLNFNNGLFSTQELDLIIRREHLKYTENIDIVTYVNEMRETHNPEGRANAAIVWDLYQQGCSVRLLNPQTYSKKVWSVLSQLQEFFGCMAGANVYLTPPGTQGFAPHWDDIEAFIIQLEGKKQWKIYEPRCEQETLPLYSSNNFTSADIGEPILDVTLQAGDLLYFPKGFIHQGKTEDDSHSLHITISVGQKNSWGDFLKMVLPRALEVAMEEDVSFRKSLPRNYLSFMGLSFADEDKHELNRNKFIGEVKSLFDKIWDHVPLDSAADQMAKNYLETSLPPCLTKAEKSLSIFGQGEIWNEKYKRIVGLAEIQPETKVRIIRRGSVRLISEDKVCIYHNLDNVRVFQGAESKCIEIEDEEACAVEYLLNKYPKFVQVDTLPLPSLEQQIGIARLLYDKGLLISEEPLKCFDDGDYSCSNCSCCEEGGCSDNDDHEKGGCSDDNDDDNEKGGCSDDDDNEKGDNVIDDDSDDEKEDNVIDGDDEKEDNVINDDDDDSSCD